MGPGVFIRGETSQNGLNIGFYPRGRERSHNILNGEESHKYINPADESTNLWKSNSPLSVLFNTVSKRNVSQPHWFQLFSAMLSQQNHQD